MTKSFDLGVNAGYRGWQILICLQEAPTKIKDKLSY